MKKILLIFFYLNVLTAQSNKYEFFLKNNGINLDLIGDKGIIIRKELDDILKQTNEENNLEIKNFWKIQYTEKEYVGTSFDKWGYAERILLYNNPTQMDAAIEKRNFTREVYENVKKEKNRIFERGTLLFKIKIKWEDLTSKNSYSQLVEKGINKNNLSKLDISVILDKIELINSSTCLAHVKINGTDEALKYHSIPKNIYKYKGNYKFKKPVYNLSLIHI